MNLGKNITKLRKEQKLSQEELAELLDVSRQTISNWELGETSPTSEQLLLLSKIFKKSTDELLGVNVKDIVIEKVNNTEKLVKKQMKFTKILFITIYTLVILSLIGYIIYCFTLKDFTNKYQGYFWCYLDDTEIYIELVPGGGKYYDSEKHEYVYKDNIYKIETTAYKNGEMKDDFTISAGYSYKEAIDSLNYVKKVIIAQGGKCK